MIQDGIDQVHDPLGLALGRIKNTYGKYASIRSKDKALDKFGFTAALISGDGLVPLTSLKYTQSAATNNITHVQANAADTQTVTVEGHYITDTGNFVFAIQTVTLTGATPVALGTPLARATRTYVKGGGNPVGPVDFTIGSGGTAVLRIDAGETQSEHAFTTISYQDFWIVNSITCSVVGGTNVVVSARLQYRSWFESDGTTPIVNPNWRNIGKRMVLIDGETESITHRELEIIPPNTDVRIAVSNTAGTASVAGSVEGWLAIDLNPPEPGTAL